MKLERFDPPGFLDDFNDDQRTRWSEMISHLFDAGVQGQPEWYDFDAPRDQFYNPMKVETGPDAQSVDISWVGFPRGVEVNSISDLQRWRRAEESRDRQDEVLFSGDSLYPGFLYVQDWTAYRHSIDRLAQFTFAHPDNYFLGAPRH